MSDPELNEEMPPPETGHRTHRVLQLVLPESAPQAPSKLAHLEQVAKIIALVGLPIVLLIVGRMWDSAAREREMARISVETERRSQLDSVERERQLSHEYVKLSLDILRSPPDKQNEDLKAWAGAVLSRYSPIPISPIDLSVLGAGSILHGSPIRKTTRNVDGLIETVTTDDGAVTRYTYDEQGRMTSVTLPNSAVATYEYDTLGNLIRTIDPAGRTTVMKYYPSKNDAPAPPPK